VSTCRGSSFSLSPVKQVDPDFQPSLAVDQVGLRRSGPVIKEKRTYFEISLMIRLRLFNFNMLHVHNSIGVFLIIFLKVV